MLYSLLFVAPCRRVAFVAACRTVYYPLLDAVQFAICCHMPYSCFFLPHAVHFAICCSAPYSCYLLPHAVHFAICCHTPYSLPFIAACRIVAIYCRMLLFVTTCHTTCYCDSMLQSLLFMHAMQYAALFVAACLIVGYWLPHPHIVCCLLLQAIQLFTCCSMPYSSLFVATCYTDCYLL